MKSTLKAILVILLSCIIVFICINYFKLNELILKQTYPKKWEEYVEKYSLEYEVDPLLIYAIIKTESNFKKDAISNMRCKRINAADG